MARARRTCVKLRVSVTVLRLAVMITTSNGQRAVRGSSGKNHPRSNRAFTAFQDQFFPDVRAPYGDVGVGGCFLKDGNVYEYYWQFAPTLSGILELRLNNHDAPGGYVGPTGGRFFNMGYRNAFIAKFGPFPP